MLQGKVILLNGVSSSGKSSLAHALQQILEVPYLHADGDVIKEMSQGVPIADRGAAFARGGFMPSLYASIPTCFAAMASFGSNLIIDDVTRPLGPNLEKLSSSAKQSGRTRFYGPVGWGSSVLAGSASAGIM